MMATGICARCGGGYDAGAGGGCALALLRDRADRDRARSTKACAMFDERWAPLLRLDGASEIEIGNYRRMYAGGFCDGADAAEKVLAAAISAELDADERRLRRLVKRLCETK